MECVNHRDCEAVGTCSYCLSPICRECLVNVRGKNYCQSCLDRVLKSSSKVKPGLSKKVLIGGIFCLIAGIIGFLGGIGWIGRGVEKEYWYESTNWGQIVLGIAFVLTGIVAFTGAMFALSRKSWGMALAGATCAILPFWLLGLPALLLIAFSRDDFDFAEEARTGENDPSYFRQRDPFYHEENNKFNQPGF